MRQEFELPWVVCEYEDVFPDDLSGLSLHRDVDFCIKLHPGTPPISMTPHRMASVELQELKYKNYWTRVLLDRALHLRAFWFCLLGNRSKFERNDLCEKELQELKRRLTSTPILIVPEGGKRYIVYFDASKDRLGYILM